MRPHPNDFDGASILENLVNETVLYVYPPRIRTVQITDQLLERRRGMKRISFQYLEQPLDLRTKIGRSSFLGVFLRLLRKVELPTHQLRVFEDLLSGSFKPLRIESRMPGMDTRKSVS
jgi:hypothetical protein